MVEISRPKNVVFFDFFPKVEGKWLLVVPYNLKFFFEKLKIWECGPKTLLKNGPKMVQKWNNFFKKNYRLYQTTLEEREEKKIIFLNELPRLYQTTLEEREEKDINFF